MTNREGRQALHDATYEIEHALVDIRYLAERLSAGAFDEHGRTEAIRHLNAALLLLNDLAALRDHGDVDA